MAEVIRPYASCWSGVGLPAFWSDQVMVANLACAERGWTVDDREGVAACAATGAAIVNVTAARAAAMARRLGRGDVMSRTPRSPCVAVRGRLTLCGYYDKARVTE